MLSVIIPVYNRNDNLSLCLMALDRQTYRDFEVIIADDGSEQNTLDVLTKNDWHFTYYYCYQRRLGTRIGQARNMGVRIAKGDRLVFIDSDILLNPTALGHYDNISKANPGAIVAGRYDWLPPMKITPGDVQHRFVTVADATLTKLPVGDAEYIGLQGPDPRSRKGGNMFEHSNLIWHSRYSLILFSGNMLWPRKIFNDVGGFNEEMTGHGGEDCELAIRAELRGVPVIFSGEVIGYHIWHHRDQDKNVSEAMKNVEYISSRYDLGKLGIKLGDSSKGEFPLTASGTEDSNSDPNI